MRGVEELIDRRDGDEPIAAVDQVTNVAGKGARIARHRHDNRNAAGGERSRLGVRALARRIEYDGIEAVELRRNERILEQIAALGGDGLEA